MSAQSPSSSGHGCLKRRRIKVHIPVGTNDIGQQRLIVDIADLSSVSTARGGPELLAHVGQLRVRSIQRNGLAVAAIAPFCHRQQGNHIAGIVEIENIGQRCIRIQRHSRAGKGITEHVLRFGIGFAAAAEPARNQIGTGRASAVTGNPDNSVIRVICAICGKIGLQRIVNLQRSLAETLMFLTCSQIKVAEPLGVCRSTLNGHAVNSPRFPVDIDFLVGYGVCHIVIIKQCQLIFASVVNGSIVIGSKAHAIQQIVYIGTIVCCHSQSNGSFG